MEDILFITIAAVLCGAETWNDIENYGRSKESWLRQYLQLPHSIPSHDTFNRFFSALNPEEFEKAFIEWVSEVAEMTQEEVLSIDGKSLRGTRERRPSQRAVHIVSAWANTNRLSSGQVKVEDKSNEITAIPKLLEVLALISIRNGRTAVIDNDVHRRRKREFIRNIICGTSIVIGKIAGILRVTVLERTAKCPYCNRIRRCRYLPCNVHCT
jgi:predicted transposase YbfD/YdcC